MSKIEDSGGVKGHVRRCFGAGLVWRAVSCDNLSQCLPKMRAAVMGASRA